MPNIESDLGFLFYDEAGAINEVFADWAIIMSTDNRIWRMGGAFYQSGAPSQ